MAVYIDSSGRFHHDRVTNSGPQIGFSAGFELPDRMLAMSQAAWGLQTFLVWGAPALNTVLPSAPFTLRMNREA